MNENKESLKDKIITVYLDGGWEVSGLVKVVDESKFILENSGDLFMIFKNRISCLIVANGEREEHVRAHGLSPTVRTSDGVVNTKEVRDDPYPMNTLSYDETVMSLPETLLGKLPEGFDDDELSVFYPSGAKITGEEGFSDSNLSFGVENDTEE
jgi:sRNA-binding regulator protein Hfq